MTKVSGEWGYVVLNDSSTIRNPATYEDSREGGKSAGYLLRTVVKMWEGSENCIPGHAKLVLVSDMWIGIVVEVERKSSEVTFEGLRLW